MERYRAKGRFEKMRAKDKCRYLACVSLKAGQVVEFNYNPDCGAVDVSSGIFDAEKWERVRQLNASFTMQSDGSMSGLFAEKKRGE